MPCFTIPRIADRTRSIRRSSPTSRTSLSGSRVRYSAPVPDPGEAAMGTRRDGYVDHGVDLHVGSGDGELLHYRSIARHLDERGVSSRRAATGARAGARSAAVSLVRAQSPLLPGVE